MSIIDGTRGDEALTLRRERLRMVHSHEVQLLGRHRRPGETDLEDYKWSEQTIVSLCMGLVTIEDDDEDGKVVRLVRFIRKSTTDIRWTQLIDSRLYGSRVLARSQNVSYPWAKFIP